MLYLNYKLFCSQDSEWKFVKLSHSSPTPTECPAHPGGHSVDLNTLAVESSEEETFLSSTLTASTTMSTFQNIPQTSITPSPGIWDVYFTCSAETTQGIDPHAELALFVGETMIEDTKVVLGSNASLLGGLIGDASALISLPVMMKTRVSVDGTQTIRAKFRAKSLGAEITVNARNITLSKA